MIDFSNVKEWMIGNSKVINAAVNGVTVWKANTIPPEYLEPFYVQNLSTTSVGEFKVAKSGSSAPTLAIYTSTDKVNWTKWCDTSQSVDTLNVQPNQKIYVRCKTNTWCTNYQFNYFRFVTTNFKVGGNIMSLLYGEDFTGMENSFPTGSSNNFRGLFYPGNGVGTKLVDASELILSATTLVNHCYYRMFQGCTSLTAAPELPATTLAEACYTQMFYGCTSLTAAPELPATTLVSSCYDGMFSGCTSLTATPELPATTLASTCYNGMFYGCTSLTAAPELPATTLAYMCYYNMFQGCTRLNYIKCLATDISANYCLSNWVKNVASSGTFVKDSSMTGFPSGTSGIPSGWTVQDA